MIYWQLFSLFARVSFLAFGGVFGLLPEIQHSVVDEHHWLSAEAFVQSFVVGQFVPGPNMAMVTLLGYRIAGLGGALAATAGMYLGPIALVAIGGRLYFRNKQREWVPRTEAALRPLVFALIFASTAMFLAQQLGKDWVLGLAVGLPVAALHWSRRLGTLSGVFVTGAVWWLFHRLGWTT